MPTKDEPINLDTLASQITARVEALREEIGPKMEELDKLEKALATLTGPKPARRGRPRKNPAT